MAKASLQETEDSVRLSTILYAVEEGQMPPKWDAKGNIIEKEETDYFDEDKFEHLKAFYDAVMEIQKRSGLFRVSFGMLTILHNDILDPNEECLALNPKYCLKEPALQKLTAALQCHPEAKNVLIQEAVALLGG
jgi:hypothetical protein